MNTRDLNQTANHDVLCFFVFCCFVFLCVCDKDERYPITVKTGKVMQPSIGAWNMYVHLPEEIKGTHMSRFIALLENNRTPLDASSFGALMRQMVKLLEADAGRIELSFPYFVNKTAPVSGVESLMDY